MINIKPYDGGATPRPRSIEGVAQLTVVEKAASQQPQPARGSLAGSFSYTAPPRALSRHTAPLRPARRAYAATFGDAGGAPAKLPLILRMCFFMTARNSASESLPSRSASPSAIRSYTTGSPSS